MPAELDRRMSAWVARNPEPVCPPQGCEQAEYNEYLRKHQEWTKAKRVAFVAAERTILERETRPPVEGEHPLPDTLREEAAAAFPLGVLPKELHDWARAVAVFNQVPPSMPATFALMAAMTAAAHLNVQIRPGWEEPCVGQILLIASPSERKSPVFSSAFAPVYEWARQEKKRAATDKANLLRELGEETVDADGNAIAIKSGSPEAKRVADLKQKLSQIRDARRRIADDITPEEFIRQMNENDGIMCLVSDEADVFQSFGGRYNSGEAKLGPLLKGWDGKQPLMYDRVGSSSSKTRTNIIIDEPRAGIGIAGQYTILDVLKKNPVYREKGMLARLLYVVLPERKTTRNLTPPAMSSAFRQEYAARIQQLFDTDAEAPLCLANKVEYANGWLMPKWLMDLRARVEVGLLDDGEFSQLRDWAGKLVSNMARIGAVLEAIGGGGEANLAALAEFFVAHGKRALHGPDSVAPQSGTALDELSTMVEKIAAKFPPAPVDASRKTSASKAFGVRDVRRSWRRLQAMPDVDLTQRLDRLVAAGHLEELPNDDAGRVGNRQAARRFRLIVQLGAKAPAPEPEPIPTEMPALPPIESPYDDLTDDWEKDL